MSYTVITPEARTTRELFELLKYDPLGCQLVGEEEIWYEVALSTEAVEEMARKAAQKKSQVCCDGPLRVRVLKREPINGAILADVGSQ